MMDIEKNNKIEEQVRSNIKEEKISEETMKILLSIGAQLNNINETQEDDGKSDRQIDFLTECMEQNLEHARHVEGERMNFIQIHLVLVGGVLAFLAESALEKKSWIVLFILIAVTLLGFFVKVLLERWNQVFIAHRACAIFCYNKIEQICSMGSKSVTEFPMNILNNVKSKVPDQYNDIMPFYPFTFSQSGKTGKLIKCFTNGLIVVTAVVAIGYFFNFWIVPIMN